MIVSPKPNNLLSGLINSTKNEKKMNKINDLNHAIVQ